MMLVTPATLRDLPLFGCYRDTIAKLKDQRFLFAYLIQSLSVSFTTYIFQQMWRLTDFAVNYHDKTLHIHKFDIYTIFTATQCLMLNTNINFGCISLYSLFSAGVFGHFFAISPIYWYLAGFWILTVLLISSLF